MGVLRENLQIALTQKLADAMNLKALPDSRDENPLFSWTANWTNVWVNRMKEELLVLVNNATWIITIGALLILKNAI